jgi:hypothetical protein
MVYTVVCSTSLLDKGDEETGALLGIIVHVPLGGSRHPIVHVE